MHLVEAVELNRSFSATLAVLAAAASMAVAGCTSTSTSATAPSSGKCQVSASGAPLQFAAGGGSGTLTISAARECGWTVAPQASWVSVSGTMSGYGDASLSYSVASNPSATQRSADVVVEGERLHLTQAAAACTYSLSRSADTIGSSGGTLSVQIVTLAGCAWTADADSAWLSLPGARTGSATSTIEVVVAQNSGIARVGSMTAAGRVYTVSQAAGGTTAPSPTPAPGPSPAPIMFTGTVSSKSGSCPTLRFNADSRVVLTDATTTFSRGKCSDLSNGDIVSVTGVVGADASVLADQIDFIKR